MRLCQLNLLSMSYSNLGVHWKVSGYVSLICYLCLIVIWEYTGKSVRLCQLNLLSMSYSNLGVHWKECEVMSA